MPSLGLTLVNTLTVNNVQFFVLPGSLQSLDCHELDTPLIFIYRERKGHSMAHDHVNECYVEIFKRIAKRGIRSLPRSAGEDFKKSGLHAMRTWDGLALASGQKKKIEANRGRAEDDSIVKCIQYFRDKHILNFTDNRDIEEFFLQGQTIPKNINASRLHGNLESRAFNYCYSNFLPSFIAKMKGRQPCSLVPAIALAPARAHADEIEDGDDDDDQDNDDNVCGQRQIRNKFFANAFLIEPKK